MSASNLLRAPLSLLFGALIAMTGFAGPATAATAPQPTATVSDRTPAAGSTVKFCGFGFQPGENVEIRFVDLEMGAVVDASGEFCKSFPLVTEKGIAVTGPRRIGALGTTSGLGASVDIVIVEVKAIVPPEAPGVIPSGAPATGAGGSSQSDNSLLVGLGGLALLLSSAAMIPAIRRRRRA